MQTSEAGYPRYIIARSRASFGPGWSLYQVGTVHQTRPVAHCGNMQGLLELLPKQCYLEVRV